MIAPARDTTADVVMPSPRPNESFLRSDHRQNPLIAATMTAMITGANSRRSSLEGIRLTLYRFQGTSLPELVSKQLTSLPGVPASTRRAPNSPSICVLKHFETYAGLIEGPRL